MESYKKEIDDLVDDRKWWQILIGIPTPYIVKREHLESDIRKTTRHLNELREDDYSSKDVAYWQKEAMYDYLRKHGFVIIHTDTEVDCVTTTTEIWRKE